LGLTTLPLSQSRLSRQCWILNISQPYRPPLLVMGIALLFCFYVLLFIIHRSIWVHNHWIWKLSLNYIDMLHIRLS
jgi:hypothetical protein